MNYRLLIIISFLSVLVSDTAYYLSASMHISIDATYLEAVMRLTSLICLLILNAKFEWKLSIPGWTRLFFKWLIIWNIICLVRGAVSAESYWDWKYLFLNSIFSMTIPYAIIVGILFTYSKDLFTLIVTKLFVFGYLIIPLTLSIDPERELYSRAIVITIGFFILLIPYIKPKWRIAIILAAATSIFLAYDFRTNVIRIVFATMLAGVYYIRRYMPLNLLKTVCTLFIIIPLLFLVLGITGVYNIFKPSDNIEKYAVASYDGQTESNLATDTRTFLYQEVLASMDTKNSFFFGEGAIGKYKTEYFLESEQATGRYGSEVGFLNAMLYTGIVGIILYSLILFSAVYYSMSYSNNFLCKMMAVFLAFRWIIFFIEDYMEYNMNYYMIWVMIGLCLSKEFRAMSDTEIRSFFTFSKNKIQRRSNKLSVQFNEPV